MHVCTSLQTDNHASTPSHQSWCRYEPLMRRSPQRPIKNESVPQTIINDTINLFFFKLQSAFWSFQTTTITVSECCLIKLLPYILSEKYVYILALETTCPGNQHCANYIGALSFLMFLFWWSFCTDEFLFTISHHRRNAQC